MLMRRLKKFVLFAALSVLAVWGITLGYLHMIQEGRIFAFTKTDAHFRYDYPTPFEELTLKTKDSTLNALYFKGKNSTGVTYYLHGKGSNLSHSKWKKIVHELATTHHQDVLMIDYRGFGKSTGPLTYEGLLSDATAGYEFLKERYAESQITVYGLSLGTSFATYIAKNNHPKQLVLEAPFYSLLDVAASTLPMVPVFMIDTILKYPFPTNEWIQGVACPIYIFHGTQDDIIPYESSLRLAELAPEPCEVTIIQGGCHNKLNLTAEYKEKAQRIFK